MSIERELLKRFMIELTTEEDVVSLFNDIKECLTQPEPTAEPVGYLYKQMDCYGEWATIFKVDKPYITWHDIKDIVPVYTAPPKRKPLTPQQISSGNQSTLNVTREAFKQGVIFAEKAHGITGGGE
jgi:hypothetical protein